MHRSLLVLAIACLTSESQSQVSPCFNAGFDQTAPGSYTGATSVSGWSVSSGTNSLCTTSVSWTPGSTEFSVVATPVLTFTYGMLGHSPLGGTNIAVMNDNIADGNITRLQRTVPVNSLTMLMQVAFAGVWQNSTHSCCNQAGFFIRLTDTLGVPLTCTTLSYSGTSCTNLQNFDQSYTANYTRWQVKTYDLTTYTSQGKVMLEIEARDCGSGDHYGQLYVDYLCDYPPIGSCFCGPFLWNWQWAHFCPGSNIASLNAPEGYAQYFWIGPAGLPIAPAQSSLAVATITNAISNNVYTVNLTTASGCVYTQTVALAASFVTIAGLATKPSCPLGTSGAATVAASGSPSNYNYLWTDFSGATVSTGSVLSNVPPGSYTVTISAAGTQSAFCGTATSTVGIASSPPVTKFSSQAYCSGQPAYLSSAPGINHQWYIGTAAVAATSGGTNSSFVLPSPHTSVMPAVAYDSPQGCRDSIRFYLFNVAPGTISLTSNPLTCAGTNTGSATLSFVPVISSPPGASTIAVNSLTNTPAYTSSTSGVYTMALTGLAANGHYLVTAFDGSCYYFDTLSVNTRARPEFSVTPALPTQLCQGQFALASVSVTNIHLGAVNYSWSPTTWLLGQNGTFAQTFITPSVAPGTSATIIYTIEVNPKAIPCPTSKTVAISVSNPVTPTISSAPVLCTNSPTFNLQAAPPGGIFAGLSPAINANGLLDLSKLPAGIHTFSYTNSMGGCQATAISQFTVNPAPALSVKGNTSICSGESTTLTASGAQTYVWQGLGTLPQAIVSPVSTSSFVVTGTSSNGCATSKSLMVKVTPIPTLAVMGPTNICSGDLLFLTASGADQYFWSTQDSASQIFLVPASTATYSVTGTNLPNFCTNTAVFTVSVLPLPQLMVSGPTSVCIGDQLTITATGAQSYQWNGLHGSATYSVILQSTNTFTITGTGQNGCSQVAHHLVVADPCAGLGEGSKLRHDIYPNPVTDKLYITIENTAKVTLTDALGKLILEKELRAGSHILNLNAIAEGVYYLQMETAGGKSVIKIIKND